MALLPANFRTTTALGNLSVRFAIVQSKFAALKVFPAFMVPKSSFKFYVYDKQNLRAEGSLDAPSGTEAHKMDYQVSTRSATTKEIGVKHLVLGKDARDFDVPVADLRQDAALSNMEKILIDMEVKGYTKISDTSNYPAALTAALTNAWSGNSGDPIEDVRLMREAVFAASAMRANKLAMNQKTLDYLKNHAAIVDRIKYVGLGAAVGDASAVIKAISSLLECEIIVSDCAKLTSNEGATDAMSTIWGNTVLCFAQGPVGLRSMTYGTTFIANNFSTKSLQRPELARGDLGAEEIETSIEYTQEFVAQVSDGDSTAGYLATGTY